MSDGCKICGEERNLEALANTNGVCANCLTVQGRKVDYIEEESKSTLKEYERKHFWDEIKKMEKDLSNNVRIIKGIVQNPMALTGEDLNNLIEVSADFIRKTGTMTTFMIQMVRYLDKKIPLNNQRKEK